MANPEFRNKLSEKVEALMQALDGGDYAENMHRARATPVIDALVDLIKAVCPVVLPQLEPTSPHVCRLLEDIKNLLRAKVAAYSTGPTATRWVEESAGLNCLLLDPVDGIEDSSSGYCTSIDEAPDDRAGGEVWDQESALMLLDNHIPEQQDTTTSATEPNDFDALLALVAEDPGLFGGTGDPLFVPQDDPDFWRMLDEPQISRVQDITEATEEPMIVPESASLVSDFQGSSHASEASEDINEMIYDPRPASSEAVSQVLEPVGTILEQGDLSQVSLHGLPSQFQFQLNWGDLMGSEANAMMAQLSGSNSPITSETADYFTSRLTETKSAADLRVCKLSFIGRVTRIPRRILVVFFEPADAAIVEVQPSTTTIIHYQIAREYEELLPATHADCHRCSQVVEGLRSLLEHEQHNWKLCLENVRVPPTVDIGIGLLWVAHLRAEERDPSLPIPAEFRLRLARDLYRDLKGACSKASLLGPLQRNFGNATVEEFWLSYGTKHGFGNRLWYKLQKLAGQPRDASQEPVGFTIANTLLLLALNIASPRALVAVQESLRQVRAYHRVTDAGRAFPETIGGTFHALMSHKEKRVLSKIGGRLAIWRLHEMKRARYCSVEALVQQIMEERPESATWDSKDIEAVMKKKKGVYWCHMVDYVASGNPNVLCLIPDSVESAPPSLNLKLNETSYRDMTIWQCKIVGQLCEELRPGIISSVDVQLANTLLYLQQPPGMYPVEQQSRYDILSQQLSSSEFFLNVLRRPLAPES